MYLAIVVALHHCKARISLSMHACFKVGSEKVAQQAKVCLGVAICMHLMHYFNIIMMIWSQVMGVMV